MYWILQCFLITKLLLLFTCHCSDLRPSDRHSVAKQSENSVGHEALNISPEVLQTTEYATKVKPWLIRHLTASESHLIDSPQLFDVSLPNKPKFFSNPVDLLEFAEIVVKTESSQLHRPVLELLRAHNYKHSTINMVVGALLRPDDDLILKILATMLPTLSSRVFFAYEMVKYSAIEPRVIEFMDLAWGFEHLDVTIMENIIMPLFMSALKKHYSGVVEMLVENIKGIVDFVNSRLRNGTILHALVANSIEKSGLNEEETELEYYSNQPSSFIAADEAIFNLMTGLHDGQRDLDHAKAKEIIDARDNDGICPVLLTVILNRPTMLKLLLKAKANTQIIYGNQTLFEVISERKSEAIAKVFNEHGHY